MFALLTQIVPEPPLHQHPITEVTVSKHQIDICSWVFDHWSNFSRIVLYCLYMRTTILRVAIPSTKEADYRFLVLQLSDSGS
ncbi:hypothetical protein E1A91_D06G160200v1 [Gossypium mustelinum]|uniref:Uncharacterized protein n=1 Tax=Gossypium mustelinum TaxID=34275 RepID=A0A5D2UMC4_GOSMU|nr:hypothetical protein E1A91_D06G160200v1 [Gossypium mustelinum]